MRHPFSTKRNAWRTRGLAFLAALAGLSPVFSQMNAHLPEGTLRLLNGDVFDGHWMPSEGGVICWRSEWFTEPVQFECRYLEELSVKTAPREYPEEPFRVLIRNGDVLHGNLVALDEQTVTLQCERHGQVRLNRSGLLKLTRLNNPSLIFSGPSSLEGWMALETESRRRRDGLREPVQFWEPMPGGGLRTERWRAELYRPLELPNKLEVDFQISCSTRPEFSLALDPDLENAFRLETWDNALVLSKGTEFFLARFLGEEERSLRMRLFWDRSKGHLSLYDERAELLVAAAFEEEKEPDPGAQVGFFIRNKSVDMKLDHLRIARWNGLPPRKMQDQGIRIRTSDGVVLRDGITGLERPGNALVLRAGERLPVSEIDTIYFRDDEKLVDQRAGVEFSYPDGTRVSGALLGVNSSEAQVRTEYAREAVVVRLAGLRQIRFPGEQGALIPDTGDELHIEGEIFRGMVAGGGEESGGHPIRWKSLGARNAVAIRPGLSAQILRRRSQAVSNLDGDRLFLRSGEILSCSVEHADEKVVRLKTGLSSLREVPAELVKAMEFRDGRLQLVGFGDREWQERSAGPGSLIREPGRLTLNGGAVYHPSLMRGDELHFGLTWKDKAQAAITLGLFGGQLADENSPLEISLTCWGNRLWVSAVETSVGQTLETEDCLVEGGSISVAIRILGERIAVQLNGIELVQFLFPPEKRTGNGLLLATGTTWPVAEGRPSPLVLDRFEVGSSTGLLNSLQVDEALKERALIVPRFRRDKPDGHILIGSNGDLIRGRLKRVTAEGVEFVTRLREVTFPRERLTGLVRLDDEVFTVPSSAEGKEVAVNLTDGSVIRMQPARMTQTLLEGSSPALGACQLPVAHIRQFSLGSFEPVPGRMLYADWVRKPAPEPVLPLDKDPGAQGVELVDEPAPDFTLRMVGGESFRLSAEKGRVVILTFWASWSGQSRQCLDELLKAVASKGERVRFVTVNQAEPEAQIRRYQERNKWSFDVAIDPAEKVGQGFGIESLPHTVIIDAEGKIRWAQSGYRLGIGAEVSDIVSELAEEAKKTPLPPVQDVPEGQGADLES